MKLNISTKPLPGIKLHNKATQILNNNFVSAIIGPPGAGKSTLLQQLIKDDRFYGEKFDHIIFVGPSQFSQIQRTQENSLEKPDMKILKQFIQQFNITNTFPDFNLLIVFDDCVTQLSQKEDFSKKLFLNRRHLIKNGTISIIITTQKFSLIPAFIRNCLTQCFFFKIPIFEINAISKWIIGKDIQKYFIQRCSSLKQNQFLFYNILKNNLFDKQFVSLVKQKCKLKINGPSGCQSFKQPSLQQKSQATLLSKQEEEDVQILMKAELSKIK